MCPLGAVFEDRGRDFSIPGTQSKAISMLLSGLSESARSKFSEGMQVSDTPPEYQPGSNPKAAAKAAKAYAKASRPWYKKKRWWAVAIVVVIIIIAAASSGGSGGGGSNTPAANDKTHSIKGSGKQSNTPAPKSTAGQVLLNVSGNGQKTTQKFTAAGDWDLAYKYDCSNFGQSGNFIVMVYGNDGNLSLSNDGPNELGMKGNDVDHEHNGGTYYLEVDTECHWSIKVTSAS